ncbi:J domain-containing protein [Christiangramia aquimixticola]|uniref:J domain-containing protein n=1 Tax=Christiangramia aquimixticola TaxID=1697558 RepID=UPI003AA8FB66
MSNNIPNITAENQELTRKLEFLHLDFLELFTLHKNMLENESGILSSLYLEKLGLLQLELLQKQTEASRLKMKMKLIQAAINRDEKPDFKAIEQEIYSRLEKYYTQIREQAAALEEANKVLSHLIPEEDVQKLKELFRVLCKRLHPDLNPKQTEEEKDLFIKVKSAYDLQRISELQNILLYLDDTTKEKLHLISSDEKVEGIKHLETQINSLKVKIEELKQSFPFNMEDLILDEGKISLKQEELRIQIKSAEEEILKHSKIIKILGDE